MDVNREQKRIQEKKTRDVPLPKMEMESLEKFPGRKRCLGRAKDFGLEGLKWGVGGGVGGGGGGG